MSGRRWLIVVSWRVSGPGGSGFCCDSGGAVVVVAEGLGHTTPAGRFFFHVMASLAQIERELTIERTRAGLEAARKNGRPPGRKRIMTDRKIAAARQLLAQGTSATDVAHNIGVSIPTLYRWIPATDR